MTINELDKAIKDIFDWDFLLSYGEDNPKVIQVGDMIERLKKLVTENYQPKTTSTDIEELRKEFTQQLTEKVPADNFSNGYIWVCSQNADDVWNFFAPHLSNKSELKKEAVEGFVRECVEAFKTLTVNPNTSDNEGAVVGGFHYDTALTKMVPDMLIAFKNEYLSSDEKEESEKQ